MILNNFWQNADLFDKIKHFLSPKLTKLRFFQTSLTFSKENVLKNKPKSEMIRGL